MLPEIAKKLSRKAQILLIEDNISDIRLTQKAFEKCRIEHVFTIARSGDEALAILSRQGEHASRPVPDLILLDLHLPKTDGKELLQKLKNNSFLKTIPVVVLTGSYAEKDVVGSYELDAYTYIVKPINLAQQTMIEDLLEKRLQG